MSGYNITNNPPNFRERTIYAQIAPNQELDRLVVNSLTINGTGPFIVNSPAVFNGGITDNGFLTVSGLATLNGGVQTTSVQASSITDTGALTVGGLATLNGGVQTSSINDTGALTVGGLATLNGGVQTTNATVSGNVTVAGVTTLGQLNVSNESVSGSLGVNVINLTGAMNNLSVNRFVDKYTINNGLGPYKVDAVPITFRDTFGMPKFSNNLSNSTGGVYTTTGGQNGKWYTTQQFDTTVGWDMTVYLPSVRTNMVTSPVFQESVLGECDNLGGWGITLADFNGPLSVPISSALSSATEQWTSYLGSAGLAALFTNFYTLAASGTTSSVDRTNALNAIYAHPDYTTIKNQFKYPVKTFNQIKSGSDFQFELLKDLNGNTGTFAYTGTGGIVYNTQITSTTYTTGSNLLPVAQNANAIAGKMGLMIFQMGDGNNQYIDAMAHQAASWGYVVAYVPGTCMSNRVNKYGSTKSIAKLCADKTIENINSTLLATGTYINAWNYFNETNDNTVTGAGTAGFWRTAFRQMLGAGPAQLIQERYYYQIKCVLNQIGVGQFIDYNNVVVAGISGGGYGMISTSKFISTGNSTQYQVNGSPVSLFKTKAYVFAQPSLFDYTGQVDAAASSNAYIYNNRFALGINVLPCPFIALTTDGDAYLNSGTTPFNDNRFNHTMQTVFQCTKQAIMNSGQQTVSTNFAKSAVFYKSVSMHVDTNPSAFRTNDGQYGDLYDSSYWAEWKNGWYLSNNPQWPAIDDTYESGLQNEIAYQMVSDIKMNTVIELMAHRFLGLEFPVPMSAFQSFGMRCDIEPTHVDLIPEMEYTRVGPIAQMTYDSGYNIVFKNTPNINQAFNIVATGSTGVFQNLNVVNTIGASNFTGGNLNIGNGSIQNLASQGAIIGSNGLQVLGNLNLWQNLLMTGALTAQGSIQCPTATIGTLNITSNFGVATGVRGSAVLTAGTVTVANTSIGTNDFILISRTAKNASTAIGEFLVTINSGVGFTVDSLNSSGSVETNDASSFRYLIVRGV